jgi:precorrin isomerase
MAEITENIFDSKGGIRADLETVRSAVPPERLEVFNTLVSAVKAAEVAEADVANAAEREAAAVKAQTEAAAAMPVRTFMDEWRAAKGSR